MNWLRRRRLERTSEPALWPRRVVGGLTRLRSSSLVARRAEAPRAKADAPPYRAQLRYNSPMSPMPNPARTAGAFGLVACALLLAPPAAGVQAPSPSLELRPHDRIVFVGNTLAERMQHFNHFETLLMARFPAHQLSVRNLGWSGDTIGLQPRPLNFGDATRHLTEQKADVILAFFGLNESFDGEAGLPAFERDLDRYVAGHLAARYNGQSAPRLVLVSPIAHEHLAHLRHVDVEGRNRELGRYTEVMKRVAARQSVVFVDLLAPTRAAMEQADTPLTINGIHLSAYGDRLVAGLLMDGLGLSAGADRDANADRSRRSTRCARTSATRTSSSSIAGGRSTPSTSSAGAWIRSARSTSRTK